MYQKCALMWGQCVPPDNKTVECGSSGPSGPTGSSGPSGPSGATWIHTNLHWTVLIACLDILVTFFFSSG
jgi:hypothetical protein